MSRISLANLIVALLFAGVVSGVVEYFTTWTVEQKQQNPAGYISKLMRDLQADLQQLDPLRIDVQQQLQLVVEDQQRIAARERAAASMAVELREMLSSGKDRLLVRGSVLTPDQVESQISSLLAEIQSSELSLSHLQGVREALEVQLEQLTAQQSEGAAGLRMLAAQHQLAVSRRFDGVSLDRLSSEVGELMSSSRELRVSAARGVSAGGSGRGLRSYDRLLTQSGD